MPLREHTQGRKARRVPVPRPVAGMARVRRVGCVWRVERRGTDRVPWRGTSVVRSVRGVCGVGVALARIVQLTWVPHIADLADLAHVPDVSNIARVADVTGIVRRMVSRRGVRVARGRCVSVSLIRGVRSVALVRVSGRWTMDATILVLCLRDFARVSRVPWIPRVSIRRPSAELGIRRVAVVGNLVAVVVQLRRAWAGRRAARDAVKLALVDGAVRDDRGVVKWLGLLWRIVIQQSRDTHPTGPRGRIDRRRRGSGVRRRWSMALSRTGREDGHTRLVR